MNRLIVYVVWLDFLWDPEKEFPWGQILHASRSRLRQGSPMDRFPQEGSCLDLEAPRKDRVNKISHNALKSCRWSSLAEVRCGISSGVHGKSMIVSLNLNTSCISDWMFSLCCPSYHPNHPQHRHSCFCCFWWSQSKGWGSDKRQMWPYKCPELMKRV